MSLAGGSGEPVRIQSGHSEGVAQSRAVDWRRRRPRTPSVLPLKESCPGKVIEEVKKGSSKWLKTQGSEFLGFHWQAGYGAFSVSQSNVEQVKRYIERQEEHHRTRAFQDEFRAFLKRYGIEFDERYVWD